MYNLKSWININWCWLSRNPNPYSIKLLEDNINKINLYSLSLNPNAISILEKKIKIDYIDNIL